MQKTFTLSEAQVLLPVLEPLLRAAIEAHRTIEDVDTELQGAIRRILMQGGVELDPFHLKRRREARESALVNLKQALEEIEASGAQLKDLDMGLLDFPCLVDGRLVLLCWRLGETTIDHWHGLEEGFAGRKKIDPAMFAPGKRSRVN